MSSNIFCINGVKYKRTTKQGRKPSGLGKARKYRLYKDDEERLKILKDSLGYYYNENEIVRCAVKFYLDNYLCNSVPPELLIPYLERSEQIMNMSKTWCPDCKREVLNVVGFIADGWEFTCGKCNQRFVVCFERVLTQRPPDVWDSAPLIYLLPKLILT